MPGSTVESFCVLLVLTAAAQTAPARPNILWISCEDSSPYAFASYGDPLAWTPNIDGVASVGVRYCIAIRWRACADAVRDYHRDVSGVDRVPLHAVPDSTAGAVCVSEHSGGYDVTNNVKTDYNFAVPKMAGTITRTRRTGEPAGREAVFLGVQQDDDARVANQGNRAAMAKVMPHVPAEKRVDPGRRICRRTGRTRRRCGSRWRISMSA